MARSSTGSTPEAPARDRRRAARSLFVLAVLCLVAPGGALADAVPPGSTDASALPAEPVGTDPLGTATVVKLVDVRDVLLDDGRTVRLAGVEPAGADLPPGVARRRGEAALDEAALAAMGALVTGKRVTLRAAGTPVDRHGRLVAHLLVDGHWVEAELLARGLARVRSRADDRAAVAQMLAIEDRARQDRLGLWAERAYDVRPAEDAARYAGTFQIVDGTVVDTATVEGAVYVHFGADWRDSFSLRIAGDAKRLCRAAHLDPRSLKGRRIRVRGFIDGVTRPVMDVTHPEQIELL